MDLVCEKRRFSSLLAAVDVSQGRTSATQQHDVKSVRNPVKTLIGRRRSYCLLIKDKRQEATKVKCKRDGSLAKQSIFVEYIHL